MKSGTSMVLSSAMIPPPCPGSGAVAAHEPRRIVMKDRCRARAIEGERRHRVTGLGHRAEGCIAGEDDMVGAEKVEAAGETVGCAEQRRVGVEHAEILDMRPAQRGEDPGMVLLLGAAAQNREAV